MAKIIEVFKILEGWKKYGIFYPLFEKYETVNTKLKVVSRQIIDEWIDDVVINVKKMPNKPIVIHTKYDCVAAYFISQGMQNKRIYARSVSFGKYTATIELFIKTTGEKKHGASKIDVNGIRIEIYFLPEEIEKITKDSLAGRVPYEYMRKLFARKKSTIVHELTHHIQFENDELDYEKQDLGQALKNLSNLKLIGNHLQLCSDNEVVATLNQAYKLYSDKYNDENGKKRFGCFYKCLFFILLTRYGINQKTIDSYLKNETSPKEIIISLKPITKFDIVWTIYCYTKNHSKFGNILFKGENGKLDFNFNEELIENNKKNIDEFFEGFSQDELKQLNFLFGEINLLKMMSEMFSITQNNKEFLDNLTNIVKLKTK